MQYCSITNIEWSWTKIWHCNDNQQPNDQLCCCYNHVTVYNEDVDKFI